MRDLWLVARREYAHFVLRRGFLISMAIVPVWIVIASILPRLAEQAVPVLSFSVVDQSGANLIEAIDVALARDEVRTGLDALASYAKSSADMDAIKAKDPEAFAILDADSNDRYQVDAVQKLGGVTALADRVKPYLKAGYPPFTAPPKRFTRVPAPDGLDVNDPAAIKAFFAGLHADQNGTKFSSILVLPAKFGEKDAPGQLWAKDLSSQRLQRFLEANLTERLQRNLMEKQGLAAEAARDIAYFDAEVERFDASPDSGGQPIAMEDRVRSIAPLALAGVLFFVVFISSTMLLGSVIEDKSTRVIEVILSCVTPNVLMTGKLLGAAGAALTIVLVWALTVTGFALFSGDIGPMLQAGLGAIVRIDFLPLALVLFVLAFLIYCSMFLIAASIAKTPQDAQAYVGPLMMVVYLPFFFLGVLLVDPNGWLASLLSYIPIYSPFILMMRLPSEPPAFDVIAGTGIALAMALFMVWLAARFYQRNAVPIEGGPSRA
jgi:ABC-2 type transport system permease protein